MADLLAASARAHAQARQQTKGAGPKRTIKKPLDLAKLHEAYTLRMAAHQIDPEHSDPAWIEEQGKTPTGRDTHDELMTFYREKLGAEQA